MYIHTIFLSWVELGGLRNRFLILLEDFCFDQALNELKRTKTQTKFFSCLQMVAKIHVSYNGDALKSSQTRPYQYWNHHSFGWFWEFTTLIHPFCEWPIFQWCQELWWFLISAPSAAGLKHYDEVPGMGFCIWGKTHYVDGVPCA
jgi:MoaA/NifB/PqqE/SkfB family radical SAM enzyme